MKGSAMLRRELKKLKSQHSYNAVIPRSTAKKGPPTVASLLATPFVKLEITSLRS